MILNTNANLINLHFILLSPKTVEPPPPKKKFTGAAETTDGNFLLFFKLYIFTLSIHDLLSLIIIIRLRKTTL